MLLHGWVLQPTDFVELGSTSKPTATNADRIEWSKAARIRMAHALSQHFCKDRAVKTHRCTKREDLKPLKPGTKVLRYFNQPPTECAKLFRNWKGGFEIKEQLDKNTYVICRSEDGRRKFIVHCENLRVLGDPEEVELSPDQDELSSPASTTAGKGRACEKARDPRHEIDGDCGTVESPKPELRRSERLRKKLTDFTKFYGIHADQSAPSGLKAGNLVAPKNPILSLTDVSAPQEE